MKTKTIARIAAYHAAIQVWLGVVSGWSARHITPKQARSISRSLLALRRTWRRKTAAIIKK